MAPYRLKIILAFLCLLQVALAGVYWFTRVTPVRVLEALVVGGEIRLRDELRPAGDGPYVLVFGIDGLGSPQFLEALRSGATPRIGGLMGDAMADGLYASAALFDSTLTVLPSSTVGAWASLFTGRPPADTGVPGNEWFDRTTMRFFAPAPVSVRDNRHTIDMLTRNLLGDALAVPTIFERLDRRTYVSFLNVHRGADLFTTPDPIVVGDLFLHLARGVAGAEEADYDSYATIDRQAVTRMIASIRNHGLADLQVFFLPGLDLYSHVTDDVLNRQIAYMRDVVDPLVGEVLDLYAEQGVLDETYVIFISDHGHTPVINDARHALGTDEEDPPAILEKLGYRVRPFSIEIREGEQDFQAVLAYQGAMAFVYLADRSTCEEPDAVCDWMRPARMEEDVMPLVRAFHRADVDGSLAAKLEGTLDMVLARTPVEAGTVPGPFQVFDGNELIPVETFVERHNRQDLIDFGRRMEELAIGPEGHRAGDIVLIARSGLERPITERFYFSDVYRSWHGSAHAQDSYVPFVIARSGMDGAAIREAVAVPGIDRPTHLHLAPVIEALFDE